MGREAGFVRLLPFVLAVALATGCRTRRIDLAVREGGTSTMDMARDVSPDVVDVARPPDTGPVVLDGGPGDASPSGDSADGAEAARAEFDRAYDAGAVSQPGHYVQFTCCVVGDANACTQAWFGGADVCYDASTWKQRAYDHCDSLGSLLTDYGVYGSC